MRFFRSVVIVWLLLAAPSVWAEGDALPSWRDGAAKQAIVAFVHDVTDARGKCFVPPEERVAVFDHDGTLMIEQPTSAEQEFIIDRVKAMSPKHPEWQTQPAIEAVLGGEPPYGGRETLHRFDALFTQACAGMTTEQYDAMVREWIGRTKDKRFGRHHDELVYQPMLELLAYLRANGFKTWIVSGSEADLIRGWSQRVYGVPPEQVIGAGVKLRFAFRDGRPELVREAEIETLDNRENKAINIGRTIGRRPIAAFGNSDGDIPMLEYTTGGEGRRLAMLIHHDDGEREYAYDRQSVGGRLDKGLDEAARRGWNVVSIKRDWARVYPFEKPAERP
jgi:hypothetical protein